MLNVTDIYKSMKIKTLSFIIIILMAFGCSKKLTSTSSKQDDPFDGKSPLIRVDGEIISQELLESIDKNDINKIDVYKGESAISKFGVQAKDGAIDIYTKTYKKLKMEELYYKLQDYLKNSTGSEDDFLFVLNGILIDESNIDQLLKLDYTEIEVVEQISAAAARAIYGDKAKPNTILVTTISK